jgi:Concanavalin A-like lectin/glucanases superfamily/Histidine kinase
VKKFSYAMPLFIFYVFVGYFLHCNNCFSQINRNTVVSYSFDNHRIMEDNNLVKPRSLGITLTEDRFGNKESAVQLNGHLFSYLNLGVSPLLQPKTTTISLWININMYIYAGKGSEGNPLLLIKNSDRDDFFVAYAIYLTSDNGSFIATATKDSTEEAIVTSSERCQYNKWYHLVITADDHSFAFYVNGKLQGRSKKNFETRFLESDSLMIGNSANKKNERYSQGYFDDIKIYHRVLGEQEIVDLYNAPNPNKTALLVKEISYWLGLVIGVFVVSFLLVWRRRRQLKISKENLDLNRKLHEMEIRTLKAQMNPHFIFNAMNSIQVFIVNQENEKAEVYLSKFSKLLRELLESNMNESLSIADEIAILKGYLEIESLRFGESFSYSIHLDQRINGNSVRIPHMMIQPFVENAVWHGLLAKKDDRKLAIYFEYDSPNTIRCTVDDNGIGRTQITIKEPTMKKKSLALSIVRQRLELMKLLLKIDCKVEIVDKTTDSGLSTGTRVIVILPILLTQ